ncbi:MAG: FtsQ-type POTRA domain-containing protein [Myxococcota bacterium]
MRAEAGGRGRSEARPGRSRADSVLLFVTALAAGAFLGARDPGELVRASLLSGFELESVAARGGSVLSASDVARSTGLRAGTPLAEVDPARVEGRLLQHAWIRDARVAPLPPGRVLVEVVEREARAVVLQGQPPVAWLVDETGEVFAKASPERAEGLAKIVVEAGTEVTLVDAIRLTDLLDRHDLPPAEEIRLGPDQAAAGVVLRLRGIPGRIVLGTGPFPPRLERLRLLLTGAPAEARAAARIDLRFGDRVVLASGKAVREAGGPRGG